MAAIEWDFETASLTPDYRALELDLLDESGVPTGLRMPVVPVELGQFVLVAIPHQFATWLSPHLFALANPSGEGTDEDGQQVTGAFLKLHADAAVALQPSTGGALWVEDGRWPWHAPLSAGAAALPLVVTSQQVVMAPRQWQDHALPPTDFTISPHAMNNSFYGGLGNGPWEGLLAIPWPPPEPEFEAPHDMTDVDGPPPQQPPREPNPLLPLAGQSPGALPRPSAKPTAGPPPAKASGKATQAQKVDQLSSDVAALNETVRNLAGLLQSGMSKGSGSADGPRPSALRPPTTKGPVSGYNPWGAPPTRPPVKFGHPPWGGPPTPTTSPTYAHPHGPPPFVPMGGPPSRPVGMMGHAATGNFGNSGTTIMGGGGEQVDSRQDLRAMLAEVMREVGAPPTTRPGKSSAPPPVPDGPITRNEIRAMMMDMMTENQPAPSLLQDSGESDISGARGAVAYSREKRRFETQPEEAYADFRLKARRMMGRAPAAPTNFRHLVTELPFGSMNTRKRVALLLFTILDEIESENWSMAKGLLVQGLRWLVLDLENPRDGLTSWRLTFLPDPVPLVCPQKTSSQLDLNNSLLDPGQLTATLGMSRDMELLSKRLKGATDNDDDDEKSAKPKKGAGKGESK